ncbi:uncharacterized protein PpBr36_09528 [Pyricularia pennisetigena]|uniref:uncharacterized protein n=1 Tax=Pyricularia pennisetigena TaxID=1578925 RepID=UPI001151D45D|nr:uncharacterized protein PpBr36_09528 [Pyricularia pennisetigena]TLS21991.1 hypothetical protein PpBr36_09528 [Pyricularia pennisetigena]
MSSYPSTSQTLQTYGDCVSSLRTSLSFLESSVQTLDSGVADFPRLCNVLKSVRHYELIPATTLSAAEASLRSEIGPFVSLLLDRAEGHLDRQARRIETLKARAELQAGRLSSTSSRPAGDDEAAAARRKPSGGRAGSAAGRRKLQGGAALRAKMLTQRKEALQYAVDRLEMEVAQKEKELRLRLGDLVAPRVHYVTLEEWQEPRQDHNPPTRNGCALTLVSHISQPENVSGITRLSGTHSYVEGPFLVVDAPSSRSRLVAGKPTSAL